MTGIDLSVVIQGMVAGRHGSHGSPTDCATAVATLLPTTIVAVVKLTTGELSLTALPNSVSDADLFQVMESSNCKRRKYAYCVSIAAEENAMKFSG